jgi:mono/diheme cytochrome c family protein/cbb3-type cytochrome oxidase cytochrome c subunit
VDAKKATRADAKTIDELEAEIDDLLSEAEPLRMDVSDLDAKLLVDKDEYEKFNTLHGSEDPRTVKARKKLDELEQQLADTIKQQDENADAQQAAEDKLKTIRAAEIDAQKEVDRLDKIVSDAKKKRNLLAGAFNAQLDFLKKPVMNAPLLDFAAPKGTLGRDEVRQVVLPDVRAEYNFLQSYTVDRCSTCHVGIDQKDFTRESLIRTFEQALPAINNALENQGAGRVRARTYENLDGETVASWFDMGRESQDAWLAEKIIPAEGMDGAQTVATLTETERHELIVSYLLRSVNVYLDSQGFDRISMKLIRPLLAHPRLDLFVGTDSPHPMASMGCTVCHEGNGDETDFVFAAHTPKNHHQLEEWEEHYLPPYGAYDFHTIEHYWDTPMLATKYTSASCAKCHEQSTDLTTREAQPIEIGRPIAEGQKLFTSLGCVNCHLVEGLGDSRRVGPDLTNLASKTTKTFAAEWIHFPKDYRPSTWMPHYFMQENNGPNTPHDRYDPDPVARTRIEAAALTHYLFETSRLNHLKQRGGDAKPWQPEAPPQDLIPTDPAAQTLAVERGRALFGAVGCLGCHGALEHQSYPDDPEAQTTWITEELARQSKENAGDQAEKQTPAQRIAFLREHYPSIGETWITQHLQDREGIGAEDAAKRVAAMSYNDRVAYAMAHFATDDATIFDGDKIGDRPVFTRFAPELSSIRSKFADDAAAVAWLYDWLRNPQHYSSYTKMPSLRLTPREALDMAMYLATLNANQAFNERLAGSTLATADPAKVDELVMTLLRGQNSEAASKMIMADSGGHLSNMLVSLLEKSYGRAPAEQAVAAMPNEDKKLFYLGSKLMSNYGCYACHLVTGYENASRPGTELTYWSEKPIAMIDFAFFSPAFDDERDEEEFGHVYREQDEHLIHHAQGNPHQEIRHNHGSFAWHKLRNPRIWDRGKDKGPYDKLKMPNFFLNDHQTDALVTFLLSRRHPLVTDAIRVDYADTAKGRLARGRSLVRELNCVGCHRIEDNAAVIHQYFRTTDGTAMFDEANAPPWLRGQGAKVQHDWLFKFLGNVEMLRPWLNVRMPSFHLDHEQTEALVEYFAGVSQYEGEVLAGLLGPVHGYVDQAGANADGSQTRGKFDLAIPTPDAAGVDWHAQPLLAKPANTLTDYGMFNRFPVDNPTDPFLEPDERTEAYRKLVNLSSFVADLYDVPFPFVEEPATFGTPDELKRGELLLYELQCLTCHVFGDPSKRSASEGPVSAPNLNLTFERLRYDWVLGWLRNPSVIQPGTKMPQLFGGGNAQSAFADLGDEAKIKALHEQFGATSGAEQIRLLTNFLFAAGAAGQDAVQPQPKAAQANASGAQD